jgi:hypothetical protein
VTLQLSLESRYWAAHFFPVRADDSAQIGNPGRRNTRFFTPLNMKMPPVGRASVPASYQFAIKRFLFVGANLVFALNARGEHKVRPYKKLSFDCKLVSVRAARDGRPTIDNHNVRRLCIFLIRCGLVAMKVCSFMNNISRISQRSRLGMWPRSEAAHCPLEKPGLPLF